MRTCFFFLLLLLSSSVQAQQTAAEKPFKSRAGGVFKVKSGSVLHGIFCSSDKQNIIFVHAQAEGKRLNKAQEEVLPFGKSIMSKKVVIDQFDPKLNYLQSGDLKYPKSAGDRMPLFFVPFGGLVYVFSSQQNPGNQTISLYGQIYSTESLELKGKEELIGSVPFQTGTAQAPTLFDWTVSPDGNYLLILSKHQQESNDYVGMTVLNKDMRTVLRKELLVPLSSGSFQVEKVLLTNDRQVYLLNRSSEDETLHFDLLHYSRGQTVFDVIGIDLPEKEKVMEVDLASGYGNRVVVAGFYNGSKKANAQSGVFWGQIKPGERHIDNYQTHLFGMDFFLANKPEKDHLWMRNMVEDGLVRATSYRLNGLLLSPDGGCYLLGEDRNSPSTQMWADASTTEPAKGFKCSQILVFRFDQAGGLIWKNKVSKLQQSSDDEGAYLSYDYFSVNDNLYFIFNEHSKLLGTSSKGYEGFTKSEKGIVALAEMKPDGSSSLSKLSSYSRTQTFLRPGMKLDWSKNEFIFLTTKDHLSLLKVFPNVTTR